VDSPIYFLEQKRAKGVKSQKGQILTSEIILIECLPTAAYQ